RLGLAAVANCLDVVAELYGRLSGELTPERSFPPGFRLAEFTHVGSPLGERAAHACSPLIVADVVLQALNGEGSIDWPKTREVQLAPSDMTSVDVGRYQLYSRQGALGSLTSLDAERAHVRETAQRAATAAQALSDLQHEWAALEGNAERLLAKAEAFKHLTFDIERGVKRDLALDAARDGRAADASPLGSYGRAATQGSAGFNIASQRGRVGRDQGLRRRSLAQRRHGMPRPGWARLSALVLTGGVLAVLTIVAIQKFWPPDPTVEVAPPQAVVAEPEPTDVEQAPPEPQNDVARQRAALDAPPNQ
ncbi:MAG TPA: hypothetical protein VF405_03450, partial [Gammaproteobacteria bacterium]